MSLLLLFNAAPVYESLWRTAERHRVEGRHQECVLFAQMAAEVASETCLSLLFLTAEPPAIRPWLETRVATNRNLARDEVRKLYVALSGDPIHEQLWWSNYKQHNELRNDVTHRGSQVTADEAARAVSAVRSLIDHLAVQPRAAS